MRDIKSMILGNDNGGGNAKSPTAPVVEKQEVKPVEQITSNPDPTVPVSSNGYAQAAARVNAVNDAIQGKAQVDKPDMQATASSSESTSSDQHKFRSTGDIVDEFYKKQLPSEEELIKEKKIEKSRAVISAIADGVSAFSNLYFTGKGARNVEQTSMSAANAKRYQAILDRRMKVQDEWGRSRLAASIKDEDTRNRWEQAAIERRYKEDMLKAKNDADVAKIKTKYENDLALLGIKIKATADESDKKRKHDDKIASQRNATAIKAAGIRSGNSGNTDRKQKEYSKYQFEKANGAPEPKRIGEKRSIYVGRNTWEQNSGQIAGEIYKDLLDQDAKLAKEFYKSVNGGYGKKSADAKQTAALVDKYIMRSPRAQQLAVELEKDYKRRYELATDGSLTHNEADDLGFTPLSSGKGSNVDVDSLFD